MSERNARDSPPLGPADIEFRPMQREDIEVGLELCRLAGWDQVQRDWERFVFAEEASVNLAVHGATGQVVGTVATIRFGAEFGWIGMLLVHPSLQGRGVGAVLLGHATAELSDVASIRLDATPAGHLLYRKHGFVDEFPLGRMEALSPRVYASVESWVQPLTEVSSDVIALDRKVFGGDRAELLEWMRQGAPEYAYVARQNGRVSGYLLGRHGHQFEHLGPIVAADTSTAVKLTSTCLAAHSGKAFVIDSSSDAPEWRRFLDDACFREQRPYVRMHRGGYGPFGLQDQQFAILGPEFG